MRPSTGDKFFTIPRLDRIPFLFHGFGTRDWGKKDLVRRPEWKDFKMVFLDQIHSNMVHVIDKAPGQNLKGDAVITGQPFFFLTVKTADCLPILIVDEQRKVIAAVHSGWRGTLKRVVQRVIQRLKTHYRCSPLSLLVGMGPRVGKGCYEVGDDVRHKYKQQKFSDEFFRPHPHQDQKYFLDLKEANVSQLLDSGLQRKNIYSLDICTHCDQRFPSYRRDREEAGRMLSFIGMSF